MTTAPAADPGADVADAPATGENNPATTVALILQNPVAAFTDEGRADQFLAAIRAEIDAFVPDVTTAKGRDAIKSLAFKVVKSKTALDAAGAELVADQKAAIAKVDAARKHLRDSLDVERDRVKAPLLAWEKAEEDRVADCQATIATIKQQGVIIQADTPETVVTRLEVLRGLTIDGARFQEFEALANAALEASKTALTNGYRQLLQAAEEAKELAALRAEKEARDAADKAAAEAAAEAQRKAQAVKELAQHIVDRADEIALGKLGGVTKPHALLAHSMEQLQLAFDAAQVDDGLGEHFQYAQQAVGRAWDRLREIGEAEEEAAAKAAQEAAAAAAEKARQDEVAKAAEEQRKRDAAAQEALAAANRETDRLAQAERDRVAAEEREARAKAAREADAAHRQTILDAVAGSLVDIVGLDAEQARATAMALAAGHIAHTSVEF